ncbi:MAG TPA: hypothetical protein VJ965_06285, partial [Anaerolineales bacterium]|nr:hypothetical protein [Anaerolineales bacterium]
MKEKVRIISTIVLLAGLLAGCSLARPPQNDNQVDQGLIQTMVAETEVAINQQPTADNSGGDTGGDTGGQDTQVPAPSNTPIPTNTPEPTATPTETPTPTVEATLPSGIDDLNLGNPDVKYTFDNDNSVYTFGGSDNKAEVKDGTYQFTMVGEIDYTVWSFPFAKVLEDYYFEVAITMPENCNPKDKAGIIFGTPDKETDNGANFQISCDGHYRLWLYDGSNTIYLINWTKADELFSGAGKTNKIGVMHRG